MGSILAKARATDVVDASVVHVARARAADIVTADRSDIERLVVAAHVSARIIDA